MGTGKNSNAIRDANGTGEVERFVRACMSEIQIKSIFILNKHYVIYNKTAGGAWDLLSTYCATEQEAWQSAKDRILTDLKKAFEK